MTTQPAIRIIAVVGMAVAVGTPGAKWAAESQFLAVQLQPTPANLEGDAELLCAALREVVRKYCEARKRR